MTTETLRIIFETLLNFHLPPYSLPPLNGQKRYLLSPRGLTPTSQYTAYPPTVSLSTGPRASSMPPFSSLLLTSPPNDIGRDPSPRSVHSIHVRSGAHHLSAIRAPATLADPYLWPPQPHPAQPLLPLPVSGPSR